jgi:hypothetical protein
MSPVRKLVLTVGIAAFVVASCGGGGKKGGGGQYGSDLLTDTTVTVAPGATTAPTPAPAAGGGKTATTKKSSTGATLAPVAKGNAIAEASHGALGDFGDVLLAPGPAKKIIYEVMIQEGLAPARATVSHVTGEIGRYSGKPVQIEQTTMPDGPTAWDDTVADRYADNYTRFKQGDNDTAVMHALFVRGQSGHGSQVLGTGIRGDVLIMYPDQYRKGGTPALSPDVVEDAVTMHETGHILGLVDFWLATGRGDYKNDPAPGGHHSPNTGSVMYYAIDTTGLFSIFSGGPPRNYDNADRADLTAIHNGAPRGSKGTTSNAVGQSRASAVPYAVGLRGLVSARAP